MQETVERNVKRFEVQKVTTLMQSFGWSLMTSQHVYSKDSHEETQTNWKGEKELYNVTETVDYQHLVFSRDTNMPNYEQLLALENEYYSIPDEPEAVHSAPSRGIVLGIFIFIVISLIAIFLEAPLLFILAVCIPAVFIYFKSKSYAKQEEAWRADQSRIESLKERKQEILKEARALA